MFVSWNNSNKKRRQKNRNKVPQRQKPETDTASTPFEKKQYDYAECWDVLFAENQSKHREFQKPSVAKNQNNKFGNIDNKWLTSKRFTFVQLHFCFHQAMCAHYYIVSEPASHTHSEQGKNTPSIDWQQMIELANVNTSIIYRLHTPSELYIN